jgi:integrase
VQRDREDNERSIPLETRATELWQEDGYSEPYIAQCRRWVRRFYATWNRRRVVPEEKLTEKDVVRFARSYARRHGIQEPVVVCNARAALSLWRKTVKTLGVDVPAWRPSPYPAEIQAVLAEYRDWCKETTGVRDSTLGVRCGHIGQFLLMKRRQRCCHQKRWEITTADIDEFVARWRPATVSGACTSLRSFLRFLHATERTPTDMSILVGSVRPPTQVPPRALPWRDIRRVLGAVDRRTSIGKRDYAMMILMASYGMGRGEVVGLSIDDIDWYQLTLRIVRAKTDVEVVLPLSDAVAGALASYLRRGRPQSSERRVFLRAVAPYAPLSAWAVSTMVSKYAMRVGIAASSHAFRHSHACLQVELTAPPKVVSDILGHTEPESLSTYVRVARNRLRALCLPIPRGRR